MISMLRFDKSSQLGRVPLLDGPFFSIRNFKNGTERTLTGRHIQLREGWGRREFYGVFFNKCTSLQLNHSNHGIPVKPIS